MELHPIHEFATLKNNLVECLTDTINIINSYDEIDSNIQNHDAAFKKKPQDIISEQIEKVKDGVFKIMVIGEFKTGKSTFLNTLLGEEILPTAVRPTTATINLIKYSENKNARIHYFGERNEEGEEISDGEIENIPLLQLKEYTTSLTAESDEKSKTVKLVEVFFPSKYCNDGVEVLDTPGLNSIYGHHERATLEYLPNGNVGIMLFSAAQFLSSSESNYIKIFKKYMNKMFFVVNKIDFIEDPNELREAIPFWEKQLKDVMKSQREIKIYPITLKNPKNDESLKNGFNEFKSEFENFLTSDSKAVEMINSPINNTLSTIADCKKNIQIKINGLKFSPEIFEKKIEENKPKLERIKRRKVELIEFISNRESLLQNRLDPEISRFIEIYLDDISNQIVNWDAGMKELESNLPQIIKESLTETCISIQEYISEEMNEIIDATGSRYNDFLDDLDEFQTSMASAENKKDNLFELDELVIESGSGIENILLFGGSAGLGYITAFLLGPIGIALAVGGGWIWGSYYDKKKLNKAATKTRDHLQKELKKAVPKIKSTMKESFNDFKEKTENHMDVLIRSVEKTIDDIKLIMKSEQSKIELKLNKYKEIQHQLIEQEEILDNIFIKS
ncbi:dynamin family protein [Candidatus Neomarinimicrobiota bacterium]